MKYQSVVILNVLALLFSNYLCANSYAPKYKEAHHFIGYQTAIHAYFNHCGVLPDRLSDLRDKPSKCNFWKGPYVEKVLDTWKREYQYRKISETLVEISSMGKDGLRETGDDIKYLISSDLWKPKNNQ